MRASTRLLALKVAAAVVPIALLIGAMHLFLPGLARRREQQLLGDRYVFEETERLRVAMPRRAVGLAPFVAKGIESFTKALYESYGDDLGLRPIDGKITIRVFATHGDLVSFAGKRMKQDLSHAGGFYDPASWSIALTLRPPRELLAMLFHEATHLLMDRSAAGPPAWSLWLGEGMAVYFEQSTVGEGRLVLGGASRRDAAVVLALARRGRHVPLRKLVRGRAELFHGELGSLCYREAGLLVAYLLEGSDGRHRDSFLRYYKLERQPGPVPPGALESHLDISLDELEKEWLAYLQGML